MILRTPNMLDVVKIAAIVYPDQTEQQAQFVSVWLKGQQQEPFLDLVAVHKKNVIGFFAGTLAHNHLTILHIRAETPDVLAAIWTKVKSVCEFESASVDAGDPDVFVELGFEPVYTTMSYQHQLVDDEAV